MSEEIIPDVPQTSDVEQTAEADASNTKESVQTESVYQGIEQAQAPEPQEKSDQEREASKAPETMKSTAVVAEAQEIDDESAEEGDNEEREMNLAEKTLSELSQLFQDLAISADRLKRFKEAEAIKSAFYKKLNKEKVDAGGSVSAEPPVGDEVHENPFDAIENGFKALYNSYKKERAEYNRQADQEREDNLTRKQAVIDDLRNLVDKQEDVNATFPAFREIQIRWRAIGPVPAQNYRDVNDTYQFLVEKFYDMVKINHDLRDLDFKKNLEAKEGFCEAAEKLSQNDNVVAAFKELQKLHEQWKEFGPVAKEYRDTIWERFKEATAIINKKYQLYFESQKEKQVENLEAKSKLCEQVEAIAEKEIPSSNDWNALTKEIEDIQKTWRSIGYATKKDNQKIYDRFRAACDKFFARKRDFYASFKNVMNDNLEKKMSLIEAAEALKDSTEWKKTTDQLINLQKQWKEIGAVPRKKSEQLWKRFRTACDDFFNQRDKQAKPENDFYSNLKAKRALIEEINSYVPVDEDAENQAMHDFMNKWQAIGFVPFKEKDNVNAAYKDAMKAKFRRFAPSFNRGGGNVGGSPRAPRNEKDRLVLRYNKLQQDIDTYENNIGFFEKSKNSEPLIKQMQERIEVAKAELNELKEQIRNAENGPAQE